MFTFSIYSSRLLLLGCGPYKYGDPWGFNAAIHTLLAKKILDTIIFKRSTKVFVLRTYLEGN